MINYQQAHSLYAKTNYSRLWVIFSLIIGLNITGYSQEKLKVVVVGLNHDHVHNVLHAFKDGKVTIIGIVEPNQQLWKRFGKQYNLPDSLFSVDLKKLLQLKRPDAVLGYNEVSGHLDIVKVCAPLHLPVMVEKPLAATLEQAKQIERLANQYNVRVLTNYETTWYASYYDVYNTINQGDIGDIKKMVMHDGHSGPKEIGCSAEFLSWLTDPVLNGAGALNDFGCYGANVMTWMMKGEKPIAVTAVTRHYKPAVYPRVEDDATVILEYPGATGLIEASWNWPFSIKDLEVFGVTGYLHALDDINITSLNHQKILSNKQVTDLPFLIKDPITYLSAVLRNQVAGTNDLSSLKYNMIVMEILDAAKKSAVSGKRVEL